MPSTTVIQPRHTMLAFFGVVYPSSNVTFTRMKYFTQLSQSKNPQEYSRKYVDEPTQITDVTGYAPQIDYGFDKYTNDPVLMDIQKITDGELIGDDAVRDIILVERPTTAISQTTAVAYRRSYTVSPGSEGDDVNIYKYSGSFKANGEIIKGTATTADDWQTITFEADGET